MLVVQMFASLLGWVYDYDFQTLGNAEKYVACSSSGSGELCKRRATVMVARLDHTSQLGK